ncbi:MAG: CPBP family intramembrane glutamic endopeptidase [Candidatus Njordarchaeia archaeon]
MINKGLIYYITLALGLMTLFNLFIFLTGIPSIYLKILGIGFMYIPIFSAFIVVKYVNKENFEKYGVSKEIRLELVPLILALIYPFIAIGLSLPLAFLTGCKIDLTMSTLVSQLKQIASELNVPVDVLIYGQIVNFAIAPFFNTIFAYGEEAGWRGYLYETLKKHYGLEWSLVLTGAIWGLWHWPLILLFGYNYPNHPDLVGGFLFILFCIGLGVFLSWLKEVTGNVVYPALAHGAINAYLGLGIYIVLVNDELYGFPAGIPVIVSMGVLAIVFYYLIKRSGTVG